MEMYGDIVVSSPQRRYRTDVIEVCVRQPNRAQSRAARLDESDEFFSLIARIDQYGVTRGLIDDEVTVLLKRSDSA
jgi:hypothetical protein